ncbi:hypothetical protein DPM19_05710 [Actinomadura craniellae]|uniref:Pycsar effector protein domain-containing protein n=1 Tax=Actinomadura craniellae TaxID=2231787 RepID=A0A365HB48_9ACTN|nr:Pycsar system effector family protein [Actinomadura craniellae]RAY16374.1 hypothetical protein DPM19_05710 [Actinomadura craniellae]
MNTEGIGLLADELAAVRGELVRIDAKCATLAGLSGAALAFLVTQTGTAEPWPVRALLAAAGIALAAAAVLLLAGVLRPRLGCTGFLRYATQSAPEIRRGLMLLNPHGVEEHQATELLVLSRIARAKNVRLRRSVDLMTAGLVLVGAALLAGVAL